MKKRKKIPYQKYMLRPMIYMSAFRFMVALIFLLAITRLVKNTPGAGMVSAFLTVLFALFAYLVYLRMDGIRIPRVKYIRPKKKKDPLRGASGMTDHVDEDPVDFSELEIDEKDFCSLVSSLVNMVIFLALSFVLS